MNTKVIWRGYFYYVVFIVGFDMPYKGKFNFIINTLKVLTWATFVGVLLWCLIDYP
ncbi:hypothetical protein GCM10009413_00150 [Tatumella punctata]